MKQKVYRNRYLICEHSFFSTYRDPLPVCCLCGDCIGRCDCCGRVYFHDSFLIMSLISALIDGGKVDCGVNLRIDGIYYFRVFSVDWTVKREMSLDSSLSKYVPNTNLSLLLILSHYTCIFSKVKKL
jgi:hypothetical protein